MRRWLLRGAGSVAMAVSLYAGAGFVLLPWLVQTQLPQWVQQNTGHTARIGEVRFDPFKLAFVARDVALAAPDGAPLFGLGALEAELRWSSLTARAWCFARVRLQAPQANLVIAPDGRFNLAEFLARLDREPAREAQPLPRFDIESLEMAAGAVSFNDRRASYETRVAPIDFAIRDLSSLPHHNGPYTLSARAAQGGVVRWKGQISLAPIAGSGELVMESISLAEPAVYAKRFTDIAAAAGKLDASLPYRFAYADGKFAADLAKASLRLVGTELRLGTEGAQTLALARLEIGGVDANSARQEAAVAEVKLADLRLRLGAAGAPALTLPQATLERLSASLARREFAVAAARIAELALRPDGAKDSAVALRELNLAGIAGSAATGEVGIESLTVAGGRIAVRRDARGEIDLLRLPAAKADRPSGAAVAAPAASPWKVTLKQIAIDSLALAYSDQTAARPLEVAVGRLGAKLALTAAQGPGGVRVAASEVNATARDLTAAGSGEPPVRVGELGLAGAALDLQAGSLGVERAWIKGADLKLARDAAGRLNLLDMVPRAAASGVTAPAAAAKAAPFTARIKLVEVSAVAAEFADAGTGLRVRTKDAFARLAGVSSDLAQPVGFEAGLSLVEGGELRAKGRAVPASGMLEAAVKVERLALATAQPLLSRVVRLNLARGSVGAEGRLTVGGKGAALSYAGSASLADLLLNEEGGKQFAALKSASAEGIAFSLGPDGLEVPELRLEGPQAQLLIEADRTLNATRLLVQAPAVTAPPSAPGAGAAAVPAAGLFPVMVRRLRISDAKLDFEDLSLRPQFGAKIHELGGVVTGLSTNPSSRTRLELDGRVDEFGQARIRGELNPFFPRRNTDVGLVFRNVDMRTATPYAMKFAGYRIADGRISLDLQYKVRDSRLEGDNKMVIERLTLGERVDSPDALKLPLELAIAILKDTDGRIDLGLPVSGSLDDPEFSYGAIIWKAVVNVITRIVTAPFRALGALFGGDGEKLESIDFDPGSALVSPPEREKLRQVAQVMAKRTQLKLAVPGTHNEEVDLPVLRESAMRSEILRRAGVRLADGEMPGPLDPGDAKQRVALRETFTARHGAPAIEELRQAADRGALPSQAGEKRDAVPAWRRAINAVQGEVSVSDPRAFYGALAARLAGSQPLAPDALARLAGSRADAIARVLGEAGVDAARVTLPPPQKADPRGQMVPVKLGLSAR